MKRQSKVLLATREICVFAMLGALMFASKKALEFLPNIHTVGMLTMLYTVVYRQKALIPLYIYVLLDGIVYGFGIAWMPYLYIWLPLWIAVMLLPKNMNKRLKIVLYPVICALHGLLFGTLYAPAQAILFGLSFKSTIAWIAAGLPYDVIHCIGNFSFGLLIYPCSLLLIKLEKLYSK